MRTAPNPTVALQWLTRQAPGNWQVDSRLVSAGDVFVAWPGASRDGRSFVSAALAAGAAACLVEAEGVTDVAGHDAWDDRVIAVADLKAALGVMASERWGRPSDQVKVVAITGTNGKTSSSWWAAQWLQAMGLNSLVVGTLGMGSPGGEWQYTGLTTPDPVAWQQKLRDWREAQGRLAVVEASSIGLQQGRLNGTRIDTAVFLNFTQDHLDFHGTMEAYWEAKAMLFDWPGLRLAVINVDDPKGMALAQRLQRQADDNALEVWTLSAQSNRARLSILHTEHTDHGMRLTVQWVSSPSGVLQQGVMDVPFVGDYNRYNLLAALAVVLGQGRQLDDALRAVGALTPVPGRMQPVPVQHVGVTRPLVLVDYAHTPDAIEKALAALRPLATARQGKLHTVLGCGGNRDAGKRPRMARVAVDGADTVAFTTDNPRDEDPLTIVQEMLGGLTDVERKAAFVHLNRADCVAHVLSNAQPQDVVLIAGKGHEDYQEVAGHRYPYTDAAAVHAWERTRSGAPALSVAQALALLPEAVCVGRPADWPMGGRVVSDTRVLQPGDLFVALRGERFDANDMLPQAKAAGAVWAMAERGLDDAGLMGAHVPHAHVALSHWARQWRQLNPVPMMAVTGSNGKTTVTQLLATICRADAPEQVCATQGNLNNDIGVPMTVLGLRPTHRWAVIELGMNHPGEIAGLAAVARPNVALVNNAQREHQEHMASVDAVARENAQVFAALPAHGVAVFPADDPYAALWQTMAQGRRTLTFAVTAGANADVTLVSQQWLGDAWALTVQTPVGVMVCRLALAGAHNVRNALAATATALAAGVPLSAVETGLNAFSPVKGRSMAMRLTHVDGRPWTLVDDSYNANPDSVRAAIDMLCSLNGPRALLLGDMGEVGSEGLAFHIEVLQHALACQVPTVWVAGDWMRHAVHAMGEQGEAVRWFDSVEAMAQAAVEASSKWQTALVKGSRFMRMERVVNALNKTNGGAHVA